MTEMEEHVISPGRPVRLVPTAPGFWMTVLGVCIAALAPLFGFLLGSMLARPEGDVMFDAVYTGLFVGVIIGGIGVALAVWGGVRLWRHTHRGETASLAEQHVEDEGEMQ